MAIGDLLMMQPEMVQPQMAPQAQPDPVQFEENKGLWKNFLGKLGDPSVRAAMAQTGINMMRSPQYGQSGWDVAANALGTGLQTLQQLREAERVKQLQMEDRRIKENQRTTENRLKDRQVTTGETNARVYERQVSGTRAGQLADDARSDEILEESKRSNRAREETDRIRANADLTRARTYSGAGRGGGRVAADIEKINRLAAQMMLPPEEGGAGLDEINAQAEATKLVELQSASKSPSAMIQDLWKTKVSTYMNSMEGMRSPLTKEMTDRFLEESISAVQRLQEVDSSARGTGRLVRETSGNATPAPGRQPPGVPPTSKQDANTLRKVEMLEGRGVTAAEIRQALIDEGKVPADYGY